MFSATLQLADAGVAQRLLGQAAHLAAGGSRCASRGIGLAADAHRAGQRAARWPTSASTSSRWPLPETPAMPRISPARTCRLSVVHGQRAAVAHRAQPVDLAARPAHRRRSQLRGARGCACRAPSARARRRARPRPSSPAPAAPASVLGHRGAGAPRLPRRSTRHVVGIGHHLAELVRDDEHGALARCARTSRTWPSTSSASCGVSTEVGSSRISRRGFR